MLLFATLLPPVLIGILLAVLFACASRRKRFFFWSILLHLGAAIAAGYVADLFGFGQIVDTLLTPDWLPLMQIVELLFCAAVVSRYRGIRLIPSPAVLAWMVLSCALLQRHLLDIDGLLCGLAVGLGFVLTAMGYFWFKQRNWPDNPVDAHGSALLIGLMFIFVPVSLNTHMPSNWSVAAGATLPWLVLCLALVLVAFISWPWPAIRPLRKTSS